MYLLRVFVRLVFAGFLVFLDLFLFLVYWVAITLARWWFPSSYLAPGIAVIDVFEVCLRELVFMLPVAVIASLRLLYCTNLPHLPLRVLVRWSSVRFYFCSTAKRLACWILIPLAFGALVWFFQAVSILEEQRGAGADSAHQKAIMIDLLSLYGTLAVCGMFLLPFVYRAMCSVVALLVPAAPPAPRTAPVRGVYLGGDSYAEQRARDLRSAEES